jgi:hypothetical protein
LIAEPFATLHSIASSLSKMALRHYDVYIEKTTPSEDSKLVIAQFPALSSQFDIEDPDELTLSIMHKSLKMKIERCDTKVDRNGSRNIYTSSRNSIDDSQLFICKVVNNRLVCQPVSQIVTIRPDFSHLNPKEEIDPNEEIRPVSVKFSANDRHHTQSKSQDKSNMDEAHEEFQEYLFRSLTDKNAKARRDLIFGKHTHIKPDPDAGLVDSKWNINLFVPDIKPKVEKMDTDDIYSMEATATVHQKRLDLIKQRVRDCLTRAKLASFEEIYRFLECYQESALIEQPQLCKKDIIDALNECAVLVQGNWAIKSEILYGDSGDKESTDVTGISINLFTAARDYLLWLFDQKRFVSRPAYAKRVKIPEHDVLELFNQLADYRPNLRKWEFKLKTDRLFILNCPEVVDRQKSIWRVTRNNKLKIFD